MNFGENEKKEVFRLLNSSESGLNENEAKKRLQKSGLNEIKEKKENKVLKILAEQINNIVVYCYIVFILFQLTGHSRA